MQPKPQPRGYSSSGYIAIVDGRRIFDYIDQMHDKFSDAIWERGVMLNDRYVAPPTQADTTQ